MDHVTGPVAYCAPGRKVDAALLLTENAQTVTEIKEHPWLTGTEVFIVYPEAFRPPSEDMPWMVQPEFGSPAWWQESLLRRVGGFAAAGSHRTVEERPADFRQPQAG